MAAIDLGSNSFHMLVARLDGGQIHVIDRARERVQMAAGFDDDNNLTPDALLRGLACLERFAERLRPIPTGKVRAVGTNTLRKARNSRAFLDRAHAVLGHPIEIISGSEEARLIYLGVAHSMSDDAGRRLVVDIGGGSTEVILGKRFEIKRADSLHMGCVSWTLRFFGDGRLRREAFRAATMAASVELEPIVRAYRKSGWESAVGASGTVRSIEQILRTNGWSESGITRDGLRQLREAMIESGKIGKLQIEGLATERASVLPGGLAILYSIFKRFKIERMAASTGALREGLINQLVGRIRHEDVRERTIRTLSERFAVDEEQARRVEQTALTCLDQVQDAWDLEDPERRLFLSWAARLHEVGLALSYSGYHNHGAYLVAHADMPGFSHGEQAQLAALIGAHRRRIKPERLDILEDSGDESAILLAVLLRLAVQLNRSRDPEPLPQFELVAGPGALTLAFPEGWLADHAMTRADLELESAMLAPAGVELRFS